MSIQALVRVERAERFALESAAQLCAPSRLPSTVIVVNLSRSGCLFWGGSGYEVGSTISIAIPGLGSKAARITRVAADGCGCAFETLLSLEEVALARAAKARGRAEASDRIRTLRHRASSAPGPDTRPSGWIAALKALGRR